MEACDIVPIGLALIVYELVTLMKMKPLRLLWIDSLRASVCVGIIAYKIVPIDSLQVVPGLNRV